MTTISDNPYASPQAEAAQVRDAVPEYDYRAVLRRWELLRLPFNLVVAVAGILPLLGALGKLGWFDAVGGMIIYGIAANLCYTAGPVLELYLNWLTDIAARRSWPRLPPVFVRSPAPTFLFFILGTGISAFVTCFGGLVYMSNL